MSDGTEHPPLSSRTLLTSDTADFDTIRRLQAERNAQATGKKGSKTFDPSSQRTDISTKASLTESFDTSLYEQNGADKFAGYHTSLAADGEDDEMPDADNSRRLIGQYTATKDQMNEFASGNGVEEEDILLGREKSARIADRETDYQKRRFERGPLTPTRADPFAANKQAGVEGHTYRDVMQLQDLEREEQRIQKLIDEKQADGESAVVEHKPTLKEEADKENSEAGSTVEAVGRKRRKRWDVSSEQTPAPDAEDSKTKRSRWDMTPVPGATLETSSKRSRWDQAPSLGAATPVGNQGLATPMHPSQGTMPTFGTDISGRNAPFRMRSLI